MEEDKDFFGDVFGEPEDDPLLGKDASSKDAPPSESADQSPPDHSGPDWVSDEQSSDAAPTAPEDAPADREAEPSPERREIVVDHENDEEDFDEINQAVGQGWRLVNISLALPDGQPSASGDRAERIVAVLEQESPQSLFDFGADT